MGEGWVGVVSQMSNDRGMHALRILQDLMIPKSYDPVAFVFQKTTAFRFLHRRQFVSTAVDFDKQARLVANKIGNVASEGHLTAESVPLDLTRS
jgi:hypothetical protein